MPSARTPPAKATLPDLGTFLTNHMEEVAAIDFFAVPPATFRILVVFVVLSHARRRALQSHVTEQPTVAPRTSRTELFARLRSGVRRS